MSVNFRRFSIVHATSVSSEVPEYYYWDKRGWQQFTARLFSA